MRVIILGSAAGGGVPQWNCGCRNCTEARHTNRSRTQSSVAVSADGERWILLNASPDLRTQLAAHRPLWPPSGSRATPLRAGVLTDGGIDHTLGLLLLRERADRLPVSRPPGRWTTPCGTWPVEPISCSSTAPSGRTTSSERPALQRRRRARWATSRSAARVAAWRSCRNSTRNASCSFMSTTPIRSCVAAQRSGRESRRRASWWERTRWSSSCERAADLGSSGRAGRPAARRVGAPLPPPPPLQPTDAPRRALAPGAAVVGGEPLLLSDQHPHQGRPDSVELSRA